MTPRLAVNLPPPSSFWYEPGGMSTGRLTAAIFDLDVVLLALPHKQAERDALMGFADPA